MKRLAVPIVSVLAACGPQAATDIEPTIQLAPGTASVTARISPVKVGKGTLYCSLHVSGDNFPGASPVIGGSREFPASASTIDCTFTSLPAGTYALSVTQDENDNGLLDTSVFGAPVEGYGASNNVLPAASAPTFADSSFAVAESAALTLDIVMRN